MFLWKIKRFTFREYLKWYFQEIAKHMHNFMMANILLFALEISFPNKGIFNDIK